MRDWIQETTKERSQNHFISDKHLPSGPILKRPKSVRSRSRHVTPITKSLSPDSKMRKKGQEFMQKITELKKDLEV
jgi:hypothetical protein